ncbi:arsenite efflux MFS transporter ArsK [Mycobacterium sp. KBS0706]|uniref:arsenite efflux MFS transporter ArsK n=1 Tax=Mycobacterium sp. KBS0706 TaxID=2578109 RepID=UPI00110FE8CB|nr:arsenite efflux MFS transporter ArsK [Mycobacterium sp. KBS0706]TSD84283.1 arsenite efflux MFS transporter ArsK [Mycobacterium sp. KBS0706]
MAEAIGAAGPVSGRRLLGVVAGLGLTQVIGYGTLYYSFSILAAGMAADIGWSQDAVYGAFSAALLAGALIGPRCGRWVDRHGAGRVMALGSVAAAAALVACAIAPGPLGLALGLVAIQVAASFVLYEVAFPALVQVAGFGARRSITHLTLIAGFASTLFWPATATLRDHLTWREVYLVFAALHLLLCLPIHLWLRSLARAAGPAAFAAAAAMVPEDAQAQHQNRRTLLVLTTAGFSLAGFVSSAVLVHMVPLLGALGLGTGSLLVGSLFGPAQVLSRFLTMTVGRGASPVGLAIVAAGLPPLALGLLLLGAPALAAALGFAILFGLGSGLNSIVRGTVPLALFGRAGYAERLGWISSVVHIVSALAPFLFAAFMERLGPAPTLWLTAGFGGLAGLVFLEIRRLSKRTPPIVTGDAVQTAGSNGASGFRRAALTACLHRR